ncbi:MAG: class I SAM-dependent methyltransferase [Flavobacteriaceae bacterium]
MKTANDLFSDDAEGYQKYRPEYPTEFLEEIISLVIQRERCWDCGTGNGQVARVLSRFFKTVKATDISQAQLKKSYRSSNIDYSVERAEDSSFPDDHFDLITVAQAVHWFDFSHFFKEAVRVSNNGCIIALWGYGLLHFNNELDALIDKFYHKLQSDWAKERRHIENNYNSIPFPFENIPLSKSYAIRLEFNLEELIGYLDTWTALKNYRKRQQLNPLKEFKEELSAVWKGNDKRKLATFPIFTKIGRISK